jgi:hypothetical protein
MPPDESQSTILRNDQRQRVVQCLAQAISGSMACSHSIRSDPFSLRALHVQSPRHTRHLRQLPRDLDTETEDLQRVSDQNSSVDMCEVRQQVRHFEKGFIKLAELPAIARFVRVPSQCPPASFELPVGT